MTLPASVMAEVMTTLHSRPGATPCSASSSRMRRSASWPSTLGMLMSMQTSE